MNFPFRTLLKTDADWIWNQDHENVFLKINDEYKKVVKLSHFERS